MDNFFKVKKQNCFALKVYNNKYENAVCVSEKVDTHRIAKITCIEAIYSFGSADDEHLTCESTK